MIMVINHSLVSCAFLPAIEGRTPKDNRFASAIDYNEMEVGIDSYKICDRISQKCPGQ